MPTAGPVATASSGFAAPVTARRKRNTGASSCCGARVRKSSRSLPAVKVSGVPWKTIARTESSASAARRLRSSSSYISHVSAFFFCGRLKPMATTASRRLTTMSIAMARFPSARRRRR